MTGGGLMRIRNDYTGFSGKGYQDNYLYKNKEAAKENDSQADRTKPDGANTENTVYRKRESTYSRDGDTCQITHTVEKETPGENTRTGILKEFWNSLGDEGQTAETGGQALHLMAAFQNIKAAFQNFVKEHITEPVRNSHRRSKRYLAGRKKCQTVLPMGKWLERAACRGIQRMERKRRIRNGSHGRMKLLAECSIPVI